MLEDNQNNKKNRLPPPQKEEQPEEHQEQEDVRYDPKCIFCKIIKGDEGIESSTVYEDDKCKIIMDIHPIRPGHVLIIPIQHYRNIMDIPLSSDVAEHMMKLAHQLTTALVVQSVQNNNNNKGDGDGDGDHDDNNQDDDPVQFVCHGTNLLWNNGRAAWQTVMHSHLHVIPRKRGDGWNFLWGMIRHLLSLLGFLPPPAKRQELDQLAEIFRQKLLRIIEQQNNKEKKKKKLS